MRNLILILFLCMSSPVLAGDFSSDINTFFDLFKKGEIDKAVDTIYKSNPYVSAIPDQVKNVKTQLASLPGLMGELRSIEKIDTLMVGKSLVHVTYMGIYDRQPVRFEFQFFKLGADWRIYSFSFDADVFSEIEKTARSQAFSTKKQ